MPLQTRSTRLDKLPPYLFAELDRRKAELIGKGVDVINLGIGDPDLPPPPRMIEALKEAISKPEFHRYSSYNGANFFRTAIAEWLQNRHDVKVDPESEMLVLIGSKEGLAHLPQAIINPGDKVLITDPCYPVHLQSMLLAGAEPKLIPVREETGFLPDVTTIPEKLWRDIKMVVINYPNNPTSATASETFLKTLVELANKHNFIICQDAAYIDISLDGTKQPSIMSIPGAKDIAIEFFSLSKTFNVCGWRLGFCIGNRDIITSLGKLKTAVDSGQFAATQWAATVGLKECMGDLQNTISVYNQRRQLLCNGLREMGLGYFESASTFYVWAKIPEKFRSQEYANILLDKLGIITAPGIGFGKAGDKYIRFSLTSPTSRIAEATERMKGANI